MKIVKKMKSMISMKIMKKKSSLNKKNQEKSSPQKNENLDWSKLNL